VAPPGSRWQFCAVFAAKSAQDCHLAGGSWPLVHVIASSRGFPTSSCAFAGAIGWGLVDVEALSAVRWRHGPHLTTETSTESGNPHPTGELPAHPESQRPNPRAPAQPERASGPTREPRPNPRAPAQPESPGPTRELPAQPESRRPNPKERAAFSPLTPPWHPPRRPAPPFAPALHSKIIAPHPPPNPESPVRPERDHETPKLSARHRAEKGGTRYNCARGMSPGGVVPSRPDKEPGRPKHDSDQALFATVVLCLTPHGGRKQPQTSVH
jgi:hypothetical protein